MADQVSNGHLVKIGQFLRS